MVLCGFLHEGLEGTTLVSLVITRTNINLFLYLFQVPAYIITLHDLLALTPHDHVERNTLEYAQSVLEELSTVRRAQ